MALPRARLGLALSGGGFRASFFHLGVLRRLAELDLLRHVGTLSTVSGGSILGAHYFLHLKKRFEDNNGVLTNDDYIRIIDDVEADFCRGNRKDLRNRLMMSVVAHFRALALGRSYGRPMARLYAKHFYRPITKKLYSKEQLKEFTRYGVPLHRAIVEPPDPTNPPSNRKHDIQSLHARFPSAGYPGRGESGERLRARNRRAGARIPHFVMNATCLNTGGRFTFMLNEIGGPNVGYVRIDEVFMLIQYKKLLDKLGTFNFTDDTFVRASEIAIREGMHAHSSARDLPGTAFQFEQRLSFPSHTAEHVRFYSAAKACSKYPAVADSQTWLRAPWSSWTPKSNLLQRMIANETETAVESLLQVDFRRLRQAKIQAWYLLDNPKDEAWRRECELDFRSALSEIDPSLVGLLGCESEVPSDAAALILDLYYFRSAEIVNYGAHLIFKEMTMARAVAASANFPPVFTPMKIYNLFDARHLDFVALTDGGVYDNQGIEAVVDDGCDYIIVSDAGGLVETEPDPADARLPMMDRIINVLMGEMRAAQMKHVQERVRDDNLVDENTVKDARQLHRFTKPVAFHITTPVTVPEETPLLRRYDPEAVAAIRTDLDAFNGVERAVLQYEGYRLADAKASPLVREGSPFAFAAAQATAKGNLPSSQAAREILRGSPRRFGRFGESRPRMAAVLLLIIASVLLVQQVGNYNWLTTRWDNDDLARGPRRLIELGDQLRVRNEFALAAAVDGTMAVRWLRTAKNVQQTTLEWIRTQSIIGFALLIWATSITVRIIRRGQAPDWVPLWLRDLGSTSMKVISPLAILRRVSNIISLVFLTVFLMTFHAKWLLGIVPLWSIPIALLFTIIHVVFTSLWLIAGWIPPQKSWLRRFRT